MDQEFANYNPNKKTHQKASAASTPSPEIMEERKEPLKQHQRVTFKDQNQVGASAKEIIMR